MASDTVLTPADKDNFVSDLVDYGTDFAAPLYAVVESIEQAVLQSPEVAALRKDAERYRWLRGRENSLETRQYNKGIYNGPSCYHEVEGIRELKWGMELDTAINAAMEKQP